VVAMFVNGAIGFQNFEEKKINQHLADAIFQ
jgi:hypothetical protein